MKKYQHVVWKFTDSEIDQACNLVRWWAGGPTVNAKLDARHYTANVKDWATRTGLLEWECKRHKTRGETPWAACEKCAPSAYPTSKRFKLVAPTDLGRFSPLWNLPVEALWRIVRDDILESRESIGFSVARKKGWANLNIYPEGNRFAEARDYTAKIEILSELSIRRYIHFQWCADIWSVRVEKEYCRE